MLAPSKEFVASLPYGKIPDRNDFTDLDADTRIKYWNIVFSETEKLAEALDKNLENKSFSTIDIMG